MPGLARPSAFSGAAPVGDSSRPALRHHAQIICVSPFSVVAVAILDQAARHRAPYRLMPAEKGHPVVGAELTTAQAWCELRGRGSLEQELRLETASNEVAGAALQNSSIKAIFCQALKTFRNWS